MFDPTTCLYCARPVERPEESPGRCNVCLLVIGLVPLEQPASEPDPDPLDG